MTVNGVKKHRPGIMKYTSSGDAVKCRVGGVGLVPLQVAGIVKTSAERERERE
jgi:hypothetical protein